MTTGGGPSVRRLGRVAYELTWEAMRAFTAARTPDTLDELWLCEHPPVYTLGVATRPEHLPRTANGIAVLKIDRGGQITYHGPGQVVAYVLADLRRLGFGVRVLVRRLETAVTSLLGQYGIAAQGRPEAPGVYVGDAKIAALGLRIRNGCCYHGLALNVDMDLAPYLAIDPCGYAGLRVTDLRALGVTAAQDAIADELAQALAVHVYAPIAATSPAAASPATVHGPAAAP
jgi:lipoyl(octanoyl) transferase